MLWNRLWSLSFPKSGVQGVQVLDERPTFLQRFRLMTTEMRREDSLTSLTCLTLNLSCDSIRGSLLWPGRSPN